MLVDRHRRRAGASAGRRHARGRRGRRRRQRHARVARGRACASRSATSRSRATASPVSPSAGPLTIGVSTDAARYAWRLGKRKGFASGPVLSADRTPAQGPLPAHRHGARQQRPRGGDRPVIDLAYAGGPIACLGLAVLLVGTHAAQPARRSRRRGSRHGPARHRARAERARRSSRSVLRQCSRRPGRSRSRSASCPWLLPIAALACIPIRIGVHVDGAGSKLLVPLYVVILGATMYLAWELVRGDRAHARARARRVAARRVSRVGRRLAHLEQGRARRRDRAARVLRAVHRARTGDRAAAVEPARREAALRRGRRDGRSCSRSSASTSTRRATSSRTRR